MKSKNIDTTVSKQILSFREATIYMDISSSYLYKLTSSNEISFSKPKGKLIYFEKTDLDNWMTSNKLHSINNLEVLSHHKANKNG